MIESFQITFSQILVLFTFIAIGYLLKKTGKVSRDFNQGLSTLLVYIFLPFLTFGNMAEHFKLRVLAEKSSLLLVATGMFLLFLAIAFIFSRVLTKNSATRDVYIYSFSFPNSGYFGNPLVLAIFGEWMLFDYIIFCIPFFIATYTFGIYVLNPDKTFRLKNLMNPIMISLLLGMVAGASGITLPPVAKTILDTGANCMAPAAMILTGIVFASNDLKKMLSNPKIYLACAIKMVLIPLVAVFLIAAAKIPENIATIMIITFTLPCGLNSVVFPEAYGGDSRTGAQLCCISTLTCLIFLPLVLAFYHLLCGIL